MHLRSTRRDWCAAPVNAPFGVAEQRGLDQVRGDGGAVQREIGFGRARALAVQGCGHQLLAAARFALDQNGKRRGRILPDLLAQLGDRRTGADDAGVLGCRPALGRGDVAGSQEQALELLGLARLGHEVDRAERARMPSVAFVVLARQYDDLDRRGQREQLGDQLEALVRTMRVRGQAEVDQRQLRGGVQLPQHALDLRPAIRRRGR